MQHKTKPQSKIFFIVLFLVLCQGFTVIAIADSTTGEYTTDKSVGISVDNNPANNTSDDVNSDASSDKSDTPTTDASPSKPSSSTNIYPDKPLPSKSYVTSAVKYASAVSLAATKQPNPPQISPSRSENTLQVAIQSSDTASSRQISVLGQTYDDSELVKVQLPPIAQSLTYVLVIVYQNGEVFARYVPVPELTPSLNSDGDQNGFNVLNYLTST